MLPLGRREQAACCCQTYAGPQGGPPDPVTSRQLQLAALTGFVQVPSGAPGQLEGTRGWGRARWGLAGGVAPLTSLGVALAPYDGRRSR